MYGLRLVTAKDEPSPIDMALVKRHLSRRDGDKSDDAYITSLVLAAMADAELATNRQIITATWELQLDRFPLRGWQERPNNWPLYGRPIRLPMAPWRVTNSVKYYDTSGVLTTWDPANYTTAGNREPAEIWPAYGKTWPVARVMPGAVLVNFDSGYGDDFTSVPTLLKHGMQMLIAHWYMNREAVVLGTIATELPQGVQNIFERFAVGDDFDDYGPRILCDVVI